MLAAADREAQVREIAAQLRCPVCQGLSVGDSPSELANEMRSLIREQLQQGKTSAEVLDYFAQRYGEWILLAPPKRGFNLMIWVLPLSCCRLARQSCIWWHVAGSGTRLPETSPSHPA